MTREEMMAAAKKGRMGAWRKHTESCPLCRDPSDLPGRGCDEGDRLHTASMQHSIELVRKYEAARARRDGDD